MIITDAPIPTGEPFASLRNTSGLFYLGGSRSMNLRSPGLINISDATDYDFYATYTPELEAYLMNEGFEYTDCGATGSPYLDILATCILAKDNVQVVLRGNADLYSNMWESVTPEFFYKFLWKSSPELVNREYISCIINQLILTSMHGKIMERNSPIDR